MRENAIQHVPSNIITHRFVACMRCDQLYLHANSRPGNYIPARKLITVRAAGVVL